MRQMDTQNGVDKRIVRPFNKECHVLNEYSVTEGVP